jgi:uncharacterized protein (DUF3084 family)
MATSQKCSTCEKASGTCLCAGCNKYYCRKDFNNHRETLLNEVEVICGDRNDLQDKINKATQNKDSHSPLLARIDEWQGTTIEKVKQVAEQARNEAKRLLDSKRTEITSQFEKFSKELVQIKETEDFVEQDLVRLKQTVHQLNQSLKELAQPSTIELHTEQSDRIEWNCLIYVEAKVSTIKNQGRRPQGTGKYTSIFRIHFLKFYFSLTENLCNV